MKLEPISKILGEEFDFVPASHILCPVCGDDYNHIGETKLVPSDDYSAWQGRGSLLSVSMWCESGHVWEIAIGFHKGFSFIFLRTHENSIDYQTYIHSPEWHEKASAAKERAGQRCQVCNKPSSEVTLDAHHRTYERLGAELPEDITVLCRNCHTLYEKNKRVPA